jgi:hypothetical protein
MIRVGEKEFKFTGSARMGGSPTVDEVTVVGIVAVDKDKLYADAFDLNDPEIDAFFELELKLEDGETMKIVTDADIYRYVLQECDHSTGWNYASHLVSTGTGNLNWADKEKIKCYMVAYMDKIDEV